MTIDRATASAALAAAQEFEQAFLPGRPPHGWEQFMCDITGLPMTVVLAVSPALSPSGRETSEQPGLVEKPPAARPESFTARVHVDQRQTAGHMAKVTERAVEYFAGFRDNNGRSVEEW